MPLWCSRCSRERQGELARGCILTSSGCALRRYAGAVGARGGDDAAADRRIARIGTALFPPGLCGTFFQRYRQRHFTRVSRLKCFGVFRWVFHRLAPGFAIEMRSTANAFWV